MAASGFANASLGVLASWIAYLQQSGLREENIFRVNEATEAAAALKSQFDKGVSCVHTRFTDHRLLCCRDMLSSFPSNAISVVHSSFHRCNQFTST